MFATQFGANMVFDRPDWDAADASTSTATSRSSQEKMAKVLNATDPDLGAFQRRGGKLILFHGWNDAALPAGGTIDYVEAVRARHGRAASPTPSCASTWFRVCSTAAAVPGATTAAGSTAAAGDARARPVGRRSSAGSRTVSRPGR